MSGSWLGRMLAELAGFAEDTQGRVRLQFNVEILNALNRVVYNDANTDPTNANFGKVTSQNNLPREIQLAAKIVF